MSAAGLVKIGRVPTKSGDFDKYNDRTIPWYNQLGNKFELKGLHFCRQFKQINLNRIAQVIQLFSNK